MKQLTQTVTMSAANGWAGNCWQTCCAMLLDVDPEVLPDQSKCDLFTTNEHGLRDTYVKGTPSYHNRLQTYLRKHHGLAYVENHNPVEILSMLRVADPGFHMMTGTTVRSAANNGARHVVVGRYGEVWWDPHPSHAGLLPEEVYWAFLVPFPKSWAESEVRRGVVPDACWCPACSP